MDRAKTQTEQLDFLVLITISACRGTACKGWSWWAMVQLMPKPAPLGQPTCLSATLEWCCGRMWLKWQTGPSRTSAGSLQRCRALTPAFEFSLECNLYSMYTIKQLCQFIVTQHCLFSLCNCFATRRAQEPPPADVKRCIVSTYANVVIVLRLLGTAERRQGTQLQQPERSVSGQCHGA